MNKQNHNIINYNYIESNHNYIRLETSSERKQYTIAWFHESIFQAIYNINECK